ncbi:MAG: DNA primase [Lachnospiraceae bacterium]|nr:DNA primase [Lachnospiraceae bacterium]
MPHFSDEFLEEVRSRNDIVDLIGQYVQLKKKGSTWFGLCPFHNEKTASFSVSRQKQMYYCFGCGAGGNVLTFLREYENLSFREAVEELAERAGMALPEEERTREDREREDKREKLLEIQKEAATYFFRLLKSPRGERAHAYFLSRGLTEETIRRFGLGYSDQYRDDLYQYLKKKGYRDELLKESGLCFFRETTGGQDKFWNRAMFPIQNINGKVIGFGGRVMGEGEPKYLNSPETPIFDKGRNLYALHLARKSREKALLLCEGYMDVIALHQAGFDNAVAALGTAYTEAHASLLKRYTDQVYLTFDSDGAGIRAALRAIPLCREAGLSCRVINLSPHKDPDELIRAEGAEGFRRRIEEAENSFFFEIRQLSLSFDQEDPEQKTAFHKALAERLLRFPDEVERENYLQALAERYHIGYEPLRKLVRRLGSEGGIVRKKVRELPDPARRGRREEHKSEAVLLSALADRPELFPKVSGFLTPEDFTEEPYHTVAELLYEQLRTASLQPAAILDRFPEEEEQRRVAAIFHARLMGMEEETLQEQALQELMIKIKEDSIREQARRMDPTDMKAQQKLLSDRKQLEEIKKESNGRE